MTNVKRRDPDPRRLSCGENFFGAGSLSPARHDIKGRHPVSGDADESDIFKRILNKGARKPSVMSQEDYEIYKLGDWKLQSGEKIVDAHIAYKTFGDPKSPAIVYPTWFSGGMSASLSELICPL